jgi:hypothetical protein
MKLTFLTCANATHLSSQQKIQNEISFIIKDDDLSHISFDEKHLNLDLEFVNSDFYQNHKEIAQSKKGAGFCIWKPYFLQKLLNQASDGDIVIYVDSTDSITSNTVKFIIDYLIKNDTFILAWHQNKSKNKILVSTKRECLIKMNCDNDKYKNAQMIEAGFLVAVASKTTKEIIDEWLNFCCEKECIVDDIMTDVANYPEYKFNRYDQSVLSVLFEKHKLTKLQQIPGIRFNVRG